MRVTFTQGNRLLGGFSTICGVVILVLTKYQNLQLVQDDKMGPGFFPTICGIAITLCGILLLLDRQGNDKKETEDNIFNANELKNLSLFVVMGISTLFLTPLIGLLPCLGLCVIAYLKIQGRETWRKAIIIGICMTVFLYILFVAFLHVPVPYGLMES